MSSLNAEVYDNPNYVGNEDTEEIQQKPEKLPIEFFIESKKIIHAFQICSKIIPSLAKESPIPILQCLKFDIKDGNLFITAVNTTQALLQFISIENTGGVDGSFLFPAREGIELIRRLPEGRFQFSKQENRLSVFYGSKRKKTTLRVLNTEEFPPLPSLQKAQTLRIPFEVLLKGAQAAEFICVDEQRPVLTGIQIYQLGDNLAFMGTDTHRIYRYVSPIRVTEGTFDSVIVPGDIFVKFIKELKDLKKLEKAASEIEMFVSGERLVLRGKTFVYFCSLLNGSYPESAHRVFSQKEQGQVVTISMNEFVDTLYRSLSMDSKDYRVTLEASPDNTLSLRVVSQNFEMEEDFEASSVDKDFRPLQFNGAFLKKALDVVDKKVVTSATLNFLPGNYPTFIRFPMDDSIDIALMPLRYK